MPLHWQTVGLVGRDSVEPYNRNSGQRPLQAPKSQNQDPSPVSTKTKHLSPVAANVATELDIELGNDARAEVLRPVNRDEWITLPVRPQDSVVSTTRGAMHVSSVIVANPPRGWRGPGLTKK